MDINIAYNACYEKNYDLALKIFKKIAELESPEAIIGLGFLYEKGLGVIKNKKYASSLYNRAEEILKIGLLEGNIRAHYVLGDWYYRCSDEWYFQNNGISDRRKKALCLITYAAERGEIDAIFYLYNFYSNTSIQGDNNKPTAINDNTAKAFKSIGKVIKNTSEEAFKWLRLSAENCHPIGMYNLGQFYRIGKLVRIDNYLSLKWLSLAHIKFNKNGDDFIGSLALDYIRVVRSLLKPQEIIDVQNLVSLFLTKNKKLMNKEFNAISLNFKED